MIGAGGLGHIGIQCLKAISPAEVIVVDTSPAARKLAEELGADGSSTPPTTPSRRCASCPATPVSRR
jgi:D-arabinose 1-dehydrogenase-like Zn-dependent alcohol dehydrogenase